jgi:hypothetical protein
MANSIKIKRSAVAAKVPLTTDIELGELAINTYDGKLYLKKDNGTASIVTVNPGGGGSGDVVGPGSSTDNAITRFDGVTGLLIQNSTATLDDSGVVSVSGANVSGLTVSSAVATDGSKNLVSVANTGTGDNVLATSATLITPALGTPTALVGTNISGTASGLSIGGNAGTVTDGVYTTDTSTVTNTMLAGSIANNKLVNSAITINGSSTSLGGSISVGTVTSVTGTSPISSSGGATPDISISAAGVSTSGYLSATDWNTFNNKGSGTVTNLTGPITSVGNATSIASQTGTGTKFVVDTSPVLVTPNLGTPTAGVLTNCTFPTLNQNTSGSSASCTGNAATATTATNLSGGTVTSYGNSSFNFTHGQNLKVGLPAANNGAGNGDAYLYLWTSEPGVTWTAGGIARNISNTPSFPRVNTALSGQMMRFDESTGILFTSIDSAGTAFSPLSMAGNNISSAGSIAGTNITAGGNVTGTSNGVVAGVVAGKMIYDQFTATAAQTTFTSSATYISGKIEVYANGVKMVNAADVTVTSGTSVVFTTGVALNTRVDLVYPT